ncbi:MAG: glycosyltransferase family 2 protein [Acidimicrobiia bacterium]
MVVPVKNRADLLRRTLDGLAAQTADDFDVIVVDDSSTDGSGDVARSAAASGLQVTVLSNQGAGAVAARATGARHATGEVLAFLDSDCVPSACWLEAGIHAIAQGADVVQGRTLPEGPVRPGERSVSVPEPDGLFATCNVFYRRSAFEVAGGFDLDAGNRFGFRHGEALRGLGFGEDTLLGWRVRRNAKFVFAPRALVHHAVLPFSPRDTIERAWAAGGFPSLLREVPELSATLLSSGVGLGDLWRVPLWAACGLALLGRPRFALVAVAAWVIRRSIPVLRDEPSWRRRPAIVAATLAADAVTAAGLAIGSARARRLIL